MKTFTVLLFTLLSAHLMNAQESITGIWNTGKANAKIEITEIEGTYSGKIISSDNAKAQIGKLLLKEIKSVDGEWQGKLWAAQKGKWMDATLKEKDNRLIITVKAGGMGKKLKWARE